MYLTLRDIITRDIITFDKIFLVSFPDPPSTLGSGNETEIFQAVFSYRNAEIGGSFIKLFKGCTITRVYQSIGDNEVKWCFVATPISI